MAKALRESSPYSVPLIIHHSETSPQITAELQKAVANSTEVEQQKPSLKFPSTQLFPGRLAEGYIAPTSNECHE
ncbi:hypothetical protein N7481_001358 [Penicillium waksmanii]|uniref:uncharacterized protein n=1 Tax=Penicillium waksmanii TaxID=69791 RepID=UPI0025477382|nr:uncharacterized protein N7481_001358 [Penicillium waksmanii]KAJ6000949.1 hypothetical protein N7481_001358 [Penicillium waksmanii]